MKKVASINPGAKFVQPHPNPTTTKADKQPITNYTKATIDTAKKTKAATAITAPAPPPPPPLPQSQLQQKPPQPGNQTTRQPDNQTTRQPDNQTTKNALRSPNDC
jgi:hypothetical protein